MLLKQSAFYALACGVPGMVNFLAMALYTRLLAPDAYGQYALVIAGTGLAHVLLFQWLRMGLLRFLPVYEAQRVVALSTILAAFVGQLGLTGAAAIVAVILIVDSGLQGLILISVALLWVNAFYQLNLELARSDLSPKRYGVAECIKAVTAIGVGGLLAYQGLGAYGVLCGLLAGIAVSSLSQAGNEWKAARLRFADVALFRRIVVYGAPLTVTCALGFVISSSDRLLLGWFLGDAAAGVYAVGYDLPQYALGMVMTIVNLAAYPLVLRALEQNGKLAADRQLSQNAMLLAGIALPTAAGLAMLAPNITEIFLGSAFRQTAAKLIPWIALAALLGGIKNFYFDLSFQLAEFTLGQVWIALATAIVNVALNCWWIPIFGVMGAAYATLVAYGAGLGLSWMLGRRVYKLPLPVKETAKVALATLGMMLALMPLVASRGLLALAGQVTIGALVYGVLLGLLNAGSLKTVISRRLNVTRGCRA